jgi:hypothetical protein
MTKPIALILFLKRCYLFWDITMCSLVSSQSTFLRNLSPDSRLKNKPNKKSACYLLRSGFLLYFSFYPEDGSDISPRNVDFHRTRLPCTLQWPLQETQIQNNYSLLYLSFMNSTAFDSVKSASRDRSLGTVSSVENVWSRAEFIFPASPRVTAHLHGV